MNSTKENLRLLLMVVFVMSAPALAIGDQEVPAGSPSASRFVCLDSTQVKVRVLAEPLPSGGEELRSFLWDNYINGPESNSFKCPVAGWADRWGAFERSLLAAAAADSLDATSLGICLARVLADAGQYAYLPIVAEYVLHDGIPAWLVLVKWEHADSSPREVLSHARVYVLAADDARQLAFETCS